LQRQDIGADKILVATKYWRRQNIRVDKIIGVYKIIGVNKIIGIYKIIGADKILASTKYKRGQNIGVNKILASMKSCLQTESWRRRRRISLLLGSAESAAADFSQAPLKISYFSLMMVLLSVHAVVK
jgi:hypothetical protein